MELQYTQGPWKFVQLNHAAISLPAKATQILMPGNAAAYVTGDNQDGNAALIAAAPDLLQAAKDAPMIPWDHNAFVGFGADQVELIKRGFTMALNMVYQKNQAAIAKATGE